MKKSNRPRLINVLLFDSYISSVIIGLPIAVLVWILNEKLSNNLWFELLVILLASIIFLFFRWKRINRLYSQGIEVTGYTVTYPRNFYIRYSYNNVEYTRFLRVSLFYLIYRLCKPNLSNVVTLLVDGKRPRRYLIRDVYD